MEKSNIIFMFRIIYSILGFLFTAKEIFADEVGWIIEQPTGTIDVSGNVSGMIATIIKYGIGIAGVLWDIGITWWGIQMVLSVGEDEKMKKARYMVIYSIVGVILAGFAYGIVNLIWNVRI